MIRIALLQLVGNGCDQEANLADGAAACRAAADLGADIALFPELWNIGFTPCPIDDEAGHREWVAQAIGYESAFFSTFRKVAARARMAIGLTYLEAHEPQPRNAFCLIDRAGETVLQYAKVHTCDFDWERAFTPGSEFRVADLQTAGGAVRVGAMICYDREFPESARVLMLKGAEIILTPNACHLNDIRVWQFKARAYENMVGVAMTNYAAPKENGRSCAFSGIACNEAEDTLDMRVVEAGEDEGVYIAEFDLEALRQYRARETWGNAFRKPYAYGPLVSPDVSEPFVRDSARRDAPAGAS